MPVLTTQPRHSAPPSLVPDSSINSQADGARSMQAIDLVPRRERLVLELFYVEDLTTTEVAAVLDMEIRDVLLSHAAAMTLLRSTFVDA